MDSFSFTMHQAAFCSSSQGWQTYTFPCVKQLPLSKAGQRQESMLPMCDPYAACRPAGSSCPLSAPARGTWSTARCATGRCPSSNSSPWWTGRCSSARRATTRSSTTSPATSKVRSQRGHRHVVHKCEEFIECPLVWDTSCYFSDTSTFNKRNPDWTNLRICSQRMVGYHGCFYWRKKHIYIFNSHGFPAIRIILLDRTFTVLYEVFETRPLPFSEWLIHQRACAVLTDIKGFPPGSCTQSSMNVN